MSDASAKGVQPPALSSDAGGLSQFAMRVLDQLSLSAWLPATFVVGSSFLILRLDSQKTPDVSSALQSLSDESFGVVVVLLFAVVIAAMIIQAFEFTVIRVLEGYWPSSFSTAGITGACVRFQRWMRSFRMKRARKVRKRAFREARDELLDVGEDPAVIDYLRSVAYGEVRSEPFDAAVVDASDEVRWQTFVSAPRLRALEATERASAGYPAPHRIMPTRLGNTLRSAEDALGLEGSEPLRTFVIRNWHLLTPEQRRLHHDYRNRLDLYCSMVVACGWGAALGVATFLLGHPKWQAAAVSFVVFGGLVLVCYRAAVTAAHGYGGALRMVRDQARAAAVDRG